MTALKLCMVSIGKGKVRVSQRLIGEGASELETIVSRAELMKGGPHLSPFADLSFPDSKKGIQIY